MVARRLRLRATIALFLQQQLAIWRWQQAHLAHTSAIASTAMHETDDATIVAVLTPLLAPLLGALANSHSAQAETASHGGSALASAQALHPPRPFTANSNAISTFTVGSSTVTRAFSVATGALPSSL